MAKGMAASHDGFRGLRALNRLAGALALAILSFPASTQAAPLTSNSGQAVIAPSYAARAQGFSTGSDLHGYDLDSVELFMGLLPSGKLNHALVTLHADDAGIPGELVARFANPQNLAVGSNTFQAPSDTWLEADTTYYLAVNVEADAGIVFGLGVTVGVGDSPDSDWSVEDMSWTRRDDGGWGIDVTSVLQFSLDGAPRTSAQTPAAATVARVAPPQEPLSGVEQPRMFVSNSEQPPSAWSRSMMGQGFTTGSAAGGYMLGSVELYLETPPAGELTMPLVTLHADEAGSPGELLARFTNPDNFTAGANRFWAPFTAVLDPNQTYYVVANLGADAPQAFNLVTSGKADVPTGDPEWRVQTGSWLLSSGWQWQPNENHGLRFALYEPGENDPQFLPEPSEEISGTPAWEPWSAPEPASVPESSSATDLLSEQELLGEPEEFAAAPPPPAPPPASSTPDETVATTPPPPPPPATSNDDDDDDDDPVPAWTRNPGTWMAAAGIVGLALAGGSDDGGTPPQEPVSVTPPPPPPASGDATLISLTVTQLDGTTITLSPLFSSQMGNYTASVPNAVAAVTILPTTTDDNAQIRYMDATDAELPDANMGLSNFQANLAEGANTFKVRVTAENDEDVATYSVTLDRGMALPAQVTGVGVEPYIEALELSWEAAELADKYMLQWKWGDQGFESGGDRELVTNGGSTASMISNLQAGMEYTMRVIALRSNVGSGPPSAEVKGIPLSVPLSSDAALSNLRVTRTNGTGIALSPAFSSTVTGYSASVAHDVSRVTILPTTSDTNAQIEYLDAGNTALADADGGTSNFQANLAVGANTFNVRITAQNGTDTETYSVTLTRAIAPADQVTTIRVLAGPEALIVLWDAAANADGYRLQWKSGKEDYESGGTREAVISNGSTEIYTILNLVAGTEYTLRLIATRTGAVDAPPSNEATGTPYAPRARSDSGGGTNTGGGSNTGGGGNTDEDSNTYTGPALTALVVTDPDDTEVTLTPSFSSSRTSYTASVANTVTWVTFKPTLGDSNLRLVYEDGANYRLNDADNNRDDFQVNLDEGANTVRLRVMSSDETILESYSVSITRAGATVVEDNNPPTFSGSSVTRSFDEDVGDGIRSGVDVGEPVTAGDSDNDTLTYTLEGPDEALFQIHDPDGQICTRPGINYDRERDSSYSVTVKADDGRGGITTIDVTILVLDVEERPQAPDRPTVSAVPDSTTKLSVTWTPPSNTGRPSISSYDIHYSRHSDQAWTDGPQNLTGTSATISNLDADTEYVVEVRATNADGDGPWSDPGTATTNADPPQIGSAVIRSLDEDVGDGTRSSVEVGSPVTASDHGSSHTYTLGGTDSGSFTIGSSTGQIRSRSSVNYDFEAQSSYSVSVESNDGNGGTESIQVTIKLNDMDEKPKKPAVPTVANITGNARAVRVTWTAPSNTGRPPITSYDLQYREGNSGPWFNGPQDQTGMTAIVTGLSPSTSYEVQVRASNADGDGPWSDSGSDSTSAALAATCAMSENGDVRLADGFTSKEGRVETCAEDPDTSGSYIWGTVCDDYWTDEDAGVVCKALGYHNSEPIGGRFLRAYFGGGALGILLDDLLCVGNESGLLDCPVQGGGLARDAIGVHNCSAETETVGVRCLTQSEYTQHVTEVEMEDPSQAPMLSVGDVTVYETAGTTIDFMVTLAGTPTGSVTVNYATQDGTAFANIDYVPKSGMVTFPLGTTTRTVSVTVLDDLVDEHDEQGERMTLRLSNAIGAGILDGVGYGTIENSDPLPQAWLARFGRAAADQAVEAISGRLTQSGPRTSHVTVAGRRLDVSGSPTQAGAAALAAGGAGTSPWGAHGATGVIGAGPGIGSAQPGTSGLQGVAGPARGYTSGGYTSGGVSGRQLLSGTSFQWALGVDDELDADGDGNPDKPANGSAGGERRANWTAWGEGAATRFSGVEESLSLQGDVVTATLGVDREGERWMAGVAVAFSEGEGAFSALGDDMAGTNTGTAGGLLATTLTSVYPYARYAVNDRLSLWGVLGYGQGELRLTEGRAGTIYDTDTGLRMGALGARGVVLDARGFELALRTDAMQVQMSSDAVIGLAGATAETGRIRALLEGSRTFTLGENRSLEPTLEFGLRHDSGDAETGSGMELGAGIRYTDAVLGLSLEANARGLVAHQDSAYEEWGAWATLRMDPGEPGRGLSLSLSPTWGAASSGIDRLWNSASTPGYGASSPGYAAGSPGYAAGSPGHAADSQGHAAGSWLDAGGRLSAELGYGVDAFQGRGMGTYYSGLERAGSGFQRWRLGKRWELGSQLQMSVEGERHESSLLAPDHAISVQGLLLW